MNRDNDKLEELEQDLLNDTGIAEALADHCDLDDEHCVACNTRDAIDNLAPMLFNADPEEVAGAMCSDLAMSLNVIAGATKAAAWLNMIALEATRIINFYEIEGDECDHDHEEDDENG